MTTMDKDTQLPADWVLPADKVAFIKDAIDILKASNRSDYESGEFDSFNHKQEGRYSAYEEVLQWIDRATEYAIKLRDMQQAFYTLDGSNKALADEYARLNKQYEAARALLEKVIYRHEGGLLPDRLLYNEIKTFLDGTK
jgi:hypothetical protein